MLKDISIVKISLYLLIIAFLWFAFFYEKETPFQPPCPQTCGPFANEECLLYGKCCALNATSYDSDGALMGGEGCCYGNGKGDTQILRNNEVAPDSNLFCYQNRLYGAQFDYLFAEKVEQCASRGNFYATKRGWKFGDAAKDPECMRRG